MDLLALLNEVLADKSKALQLVAALVDAGIGTTRRTCERSRKF